MSISPEQGAFAVPSLMTEAVAPSHITRRIATAVMAVGLLAGCTEQGVDRHVTPQPSVSAVEQGQDALSTPGPCIQPLEKEGERFRKAAERCADAMDGGTIALVDFSGNNAKATKRTATALVGALREGTAGLIDMKVTAVKASSEAESQFEAQTEKADCVDPDKPEQYAAASAVRTMPELAKYDIVVGLSDMESCENGVGGAAEPLQRRVADVWEASNITPEELGVRAAHEIGHLYHSGHAGDFTGVEGDERSNLSGLDYQDNARLDLTTYLTHGEYDEYGGGAPEGYLMGAGQTEIRPNALQVAQLSWPHAALGRQKAPEAVEPTGKWQPIAIRKNNQSDYARISLPEPVTINDGNGNLATRITELNLVPQTDDEGGIHAEVLATDTHRNIADLGSWYLFKDKAVGHIATAGGTVEFKAGNNTLLVRIAE